MRDQEQISHSCKTDKMIGLYVYIGFYITDGERKNSESIGRKHPPNLIY
jgi:hypothetical protein